MTFFLYRHTHIALNSQLNWRVICLTIEKRTVAVLLAVQIIFQTEHIVRAVLIHRSVCVRADHQSSVTAVTHQDHSHHQRCRIQPTPQVLSIAFCIFGIRTFLRVQNSPNQQTCNQHKCHRQTGIERTAETVDKCQLKPTDYGRNAWNNSVQNHQQNETRCQECIDHSFPTELIAAEVIYQTDGRNGQQVQQVYADTQSHQISDGDQPAVTTLFVCQFVPFQDQPEHYCREQRRTGIYLAFHCRKPERVAKRVSQSTNCSCSKNTDSLP